MRFVFFMTFKYVFFGLLKTCKGERNSSVKRSETTIKNTVYCLVSNIVLHYLTNFEQTIEWNAVNLKNLENFIHKILFPTKSEDKINS